MKENICKWCDCQGVNIQSIKNVHKTQFKKKKQKAAESIGDQRSE